MRFIDEVIKNCEWCGEKFLTKIRAKRYCCGECYKQNLQHKRAIKAEENWVLFARICKECGKEFNTITYKQTFCSLYCRELSKNRKKLEKWANAQPKKKVRRKNLKMRMFYELGDMPSDTALKRYTACRG
jgi:hypothetical protein